MKNRIQSKIVAASIASTLLAATTAVLADGTQYYKGQGFTFDGTTWTLNDQRCGKEGEGIANDGSTGQFANWNGPGQPYNSGDPYLVWILTTNGATSATITLPDGPHAMIQVGGTFKYASQYYLPADVIGVVYATWVGGKNKATLTVSHGCPVYNQGAWCSPGFWKNARDGAWTLIGGTTLKDTLFNDTVVSDFYDTTSSYNPTLWNVLTYTGQGGANHYGASASPYGLNAFNATGAYLTNRLPGYAFDVNLVGVEPEQCPIDSWGNWKNSTP
jgi:hypothetical protein